MNNSFAGAGLTEQQATKTYEVGALGGDEPSVSPLHPLRVPQSLLRLYGSLE
jgi:hypothetical protein